MADPNDPIKRALEAERLLNHPMVAEAREHIRESLARSAWRRQHLAADEQQKLDALITHYETFFAWFDRVMAGGRMAEAEVKEKGRVRKAVAQVRGQLWPM
jgi:hypothetical protein